MKNKEATEEEFKAVAKESLLKRMDKPLNPSTDYPTAKQPKEKFKLERNPR